MSADMIVFNNPEFGEVRRVEIDGEYWLVGVDVARALGYQKPHGALKNHVDREDSLKRGVLDVYGIEQPTIIINESGVYSLIFASKLPNAKKFKKWVTTEVLPSIRKTGSYTAQPQPPALTPAQLIAAQAQLLVDMEAKMQAIQEQNTAMQAQYQQLAQKVDNAVKVMSAPSEDHWKEDINRAIRDLCQARGWSDFSTRGKMYRDLERKVNCDLTSRQTRMRTRMKRAGAKQKELNAVGKIDAIAADMQLRAAFELVLKEWQARSVVLDGQKTIVVQDQFELVD